MKEIIRFELNKKPLELSVNADDSLLWVIRSSLNLTGTKFGCGIAQCGACTVFVNGRAQTACTQPAASGMVVENNTDAIMAIRKQIIEMLMIKYFHEPP